MSQSNNYLSSIRSLLERVSHGKPVQVTGPAGSKVKSSKGAVNVGFAFDNAIFQFMRNTKVPVPMLMTQFSAGFGGPPLFSELVAGVHPTLASVILAQVLNEKMANGRLDLAATVQTIATTEGVAPEYIPELLSAAQEFITKIHTRSFAKLVSSLMIDGSTGRLGAEYLGGFSCPIQLTMDTFSDSFKFLSRVYGDLASGADIEAIASYLPQLPDQKVYAACYNIYTGSKTLPVPSSAMSLYSLYDMHLNSGAAESAVRNASKGVQEKVNAKGNPRSRRGTIVSDSKDERRVIKGFLPTVSPIKYEGDTVPSGADLLFGLPKNVSADQLLQIKYWQVSNPLAGTVDIADIIQSLIEFDSSVFGLPTYAVNLQSAIDFTVYRGTPTGLPAFPVESEGLWGREEIQMLLGYVCLHHLTSNTGDSLAATLDGFLKQYKTTDTNSYLIPKLRCHIATAVAIFKTFCSFRNMLQDAVENFEAFSLETTEANASAVQIAHTRLMQKTAVGRYLSMYSATLDNLAQLPITEGSPASLFHLSRVQAVPSLFALHDFSFESSVVLHPQYFMENGILNIRRPFIEYKDDEALFLSTGPTPRPNQSSPTVTAAFNRLRGITERHSLVHGVVEQVDSGGFQIADLIRHVSTHVLEAYSKAGRAKAVFDANGRLNMNLIVSALMARSIQGFKTGLGNSALVEAILGVAMPDSGEILVEKGDYNDVIRKRYITSYVPGLVTLDDSSQVAITALIDSGSFVDLGNSNFVFLFEATDQVRCEEAESFTDALSLPFPLMVVHASDMFRGMSIRHLVDGTASSPNRSPLDAEFGRAKQFQHSEEKSLRLGEPDTTPAKVNNINDMVLKDADEGDVKQRVKAGPDALDDITQSGGKLDFSTESDEDKDTKNSKS